MDMDSRIQQLSGTWAKLYTSPEPELKQSLNSVDSQTDKALLLKSIPPPPTPSHRPLQLLHTFLTGISGNWPVFDLISCHTRLLKYLPDDTTSRADPDVKALVESTSDLIKKSYSAFSDFLVDDSQPALRTTQPEKYISHRGLKNYVSNFRLPVGTESTPTVAIALPNGPLLAATCIATTTYFTSAPINPAVGPEQFEADVKQSRASFILTTPEYYDKLELRTWTTDAKIDIVFVDWDEGDKIVLQSPDGRALSTTEGYRRTNAPNDIGLVLFTSGTSGTKKTVPLTVHSIVSGIVFVAESWGLSKSDVCLNMMPLYHVGGLVRNIFAPIFSGGMTVCCSAFDPTTFWDVVESLQPTWYYASPSMHSVILGEAAARPEALQKSKVRLVCNAAGGLLPSLACQLRDTFNCVVLPSYGMTECMPISTPPLDYKLDREGTSGISTGPDLTILDWSENYVDPGTVGRVCVRGEPVFPGYVKPDGTLDKSAFNPDGWFDTGDLGYMDADGYLYITGRSKEVINRGGELISPFEVENAILSASMSPDTPISGRVSQVLAFSTGHDVLQEVVAVALVTPDDKPRVDLKTLHNTLRSSLHQAKWPALVTYMNDLPKKNNKILRTKLSERLNLPKISDDMQPLERHWEGDCPPVDTALSEPIPSRPCSINGLEISKTLDRALPDELDHHLHGDSTVFISPSKPGICKGDKELVNHVKDTMAGCIHNYMIPTQFHLMPEPFPRTHSGSIDEAKLLQEHKELQGKSAAQLDDTTEGRVTKAFAEILQCGPDEISPNIDFFTLGGDSLRAGRLVSLLRNEFKVSIPISIVFNYGTVKAIASHLEEISGPGGSMDIPDNTAGCAETRSSTNPFLMLLQLIPIVVIYPIRRALQWTAFLTFFTFTGTWSTSDNVIGRLFNLTVSIMFGQILVRCFTPFVGILAKWIIIGRHREGLYPMWGLYHTRWWLVQKIVSVCGKGIFKFNNTTEVLYLRLMGAKVGKGVKIDNVQMGEWDLLDIRDGAALAGCMCRPFAAEGNTSMYLGRIVIGEKAFVGSSSIVAAGTEVPADTCIGPNSSSWEVSDAEEENRELTPSAAAKPHWVLTLLITIPLSMVAWFCSLIPWLAGLLGMMITKPVAPNTPLTSIVTWFSDPERVGYHYFALILRTIFAPFIFFMFTVVVRSALDLLFGRLPRGSDKPLGTVDVWRAGLIKSLLPVGRLHKMTDMFGQHYEATSIAVRMLGGNIGKRVYWPGTGPSIGDYHLLDIGDDVVFGSRSHIVTSDGFGSAPVRIGDGAMIADRVTLLPGVDIGDGAIMGSGAMTRRGKSYGPHGTYVGSKGGDSVCLSAGSKEQEKGLSSGTSSETASESNYSPFGRAFYMKQAPYRVLGPFAIFCYSAFTTVFTAFYWNVPNISSVQIVNVVMTRCVPNGIGMWWDVLAVFLMMCVLIAILTTLEAILALAIVIASKWALLGRRKPGNYDWDKSPYCQRWQMFLCIEKLRRNCYSGQGILNLLTGTHWLVLYFKALGADIGKDCALFANGKPSLMFTEPDLIKLGDRVVVDDASVVAHINTRGKFDLNPLEIGDRCVLRCGSRLLSGARMKDDSCLLEHTLIMGGDIVEDRWTMQGWPAERFTGPRIKNA